MRNGRSVVVTGKHKAAWEAKAELGTLDGCEAALRDGGYGAEYLIGYIAAHVVIHDTLMERFGDSPRADEIQGYLLGALEELIGLLEHMGVDIGAEEG